MLILSDYVIICPHLYETILEANPYVKMIVESGIYWLLDNQSRDWHEGWIRTFRGGVSSVGDV
ncbi:hypothetical protein [Ktedonospora formicarum]|uniref:Uncharacterized protein n=1 Tax=Ktedonospora formicarum TaxID=2778364 RepID=A0A8J3MU57_9CHLR|nr:hypothetical protein [Ktedonospora formicarum]GHO48942.1 hypothetical protein KSX_71050 [Ktedonospora formicarum]